MTLHYLEINGVKNKQRWQYLCLICSNKEHMMQEISAARGGRYMKTKYSIVREYIEKRILDETYMSNEKIESESELMKRFGVSRHTVRLGIGDLVTEGWLYREQGAGTFCADRSKRERQKNNDVKTIAIIATYISDYIFPSIIQGAEARLSEEGYQVSIFSTNNSFEKEKEVLEKVLLQHFDGIIVEPTKSACPNPNITYYLDLEHLNIPYIMINAYYDVLKPYYIAMDDEKGGFLQTEYLMKNGHRHIVGLFKSDDLQGEKRLKGFIHAHREYHVDVNPTNIITYDTEDETDKIKQKLEEILEQDQQITAIACYNDQLAMEVLDVLRKKQLQIPQNISIIGFDDSPLANISEVKLTSIPHPKSEMGKEAANKIIALIQTRQANKQETAPIVESIQYEPKIKERSSVLDLENEEIKEIQ